jgi:phage N-6-adenine-methyltransferase
MTITPILFSSATDEWPTPQAFFDKLDRRYHFTLDPCATPENAKCSLYFTREQDGLKQDWGTHRVFCNPPYGRRESGKWTRKCFEASQSGALVVLLVPARVDMKWFHDEHVAVMSPVADAVEVRHAVVVAADRLAVDQARGSL